MNKKASFLLNLQDRVIGFLFIVMGILLIIIVFNGYSDRFEEKVAFDRTPYLVKDFLYQLSITPVIVDGEQILFSDALVEYVQLYRLDDRTDEQDDRQQELYTALSTASRQRSGDRFVVIELYDGETRIDRINLDRMATYVPPLTEENSLVLAYQSSQEKKYLLYLYADYDATKLEITTGNKVLGPLK